MKDLKEIENIARKLPEEISYKEALESFKLTNKNLKGIIHKRKLKSEIKRGKRLYNKRNIIEAIYNIEIIDGRTLKYKEYYNNLQKLLSDAIHENSIQSLFAILEVGGIYFGHWNPTEEIRRFFDDFNPLLKETSNSKEKYYRKYRIALLMYCHAVEMNFGHQFIANIVRIKNGESYVIDPFEHLRRSHRGKLGTIPPSAKYKFQEINKLSNKIDEINLTKSIGEFFNDNIRNAFSHSDYCLSENGIRYIKDGSYTEMNYSELDSLITNCFAFYEALFHVHTWAKSFYASMKRFHKQKNYEVMELLKKNKQVYGFKLHFSNGSMATFTREPEKVLAVNIVIESNGSINFQVGDLDSLTNEWKVNGKVFNEK